MGYCKHHDRAFPNGHISLQVLKDLKSHQCACGGCGRSSHVLWTCTISYFHCWFTRVHGLNSVSNNADQISRVSLHGLNTDCRNWRASAAQFNHVDFHSSHNLEIAHRPTTTIASQPMRVHKPTPATPVHYCTGSGCTNFCHSTVALFNYILRQSVQRRVIYGHYWSHKTENLCCLQSESGAFSSKLCD